VDRDRLASLRRMAEERPQDSRVRFGLAVELLNAGYAKEGVEALRAYLSMERQDGSAWGRLGAALVGTGEYRAAVEAYQRGLDVAREGGHGSLLDGLEEGLAEAREGLR